MQAMGAVMGKHTDPTGAAVSGRNNATSTMGALAAGSAGVWGMAPSELDYAGLAIAGRAMFFTRSGMLTIAKNKSSVTATVSPLSTTGSMPSLVLATLQTNRNGTYIQAAVANAATGKITIYLNKKVTAATKVAYFVLN